MEENNQEQTLEQEVIAEQVKKDLENANNNSEEETTDEEEFLDLTKDEVVEEKKFQEVVNAADALDEQDKKQIVPIDNINTEPEVPDVEPAQLKESTEDIVPVVPTETANVIKDQDFIFLQYECENPKCGLKFYINNVDDKIGDNLKCYYCKKKLANKRRMFDVNLKAYKEIPKPVVEKKADEEEIF